MQRKHSKTVRVAALSAALVAGSVALGAPAQADPTGDAFLAALTAAGVGSADPATAIALGQSVCPMLAEPGQTAASVASTVADSAGLSLGAANLFAGIAVTFFCPAVVSSIGKGTSPVPLSILGF